MSNSISLPFSFTSGGSVNTSSSESKQWSDRVLGTIFTQPLDRIMRPGFGSYATSAVFEPEGTVVDFVTRTVTAAFNEFLPNLTLLNVAVTKETTSGLDDPALVISVEYELPSKQIDTVTTKVGIFTRAGELIQEIK